MASNDGDVTFRGFGAGDGGEETGGTDDVEGSYTEEAGGVEYASFFEGGSDDGDGGVYGVGDYEDVRCWRDTGDGGSEVTDYRGVCLDEELGGV